MPENPPYMPTGVGMAIIGDDETRIGILIFETPQGNFGFAVNLKAVDVITNAINKIEQELRSDRKTH
jgi:hypothetical protein